MKKKTTKQIKAEFERYCDRCLKLAVKEYLNRSDHSELRELEIQIAFRLEAPCKTEYCQEQCNEFYESEAKK